MCRRHWSAQSRRRRGSHWPSASTLGACAAQPPRRAVRRQCGGGARDANQAGSAAVGPSAGQRVVSERLHDRRAALNGVGGPAATKRPAASAIRCAVHPSCILHIQRPRCAERADAVSCAPTLPVCASWSTPCKGLFPCVVQGLAERTRHTQVSTAEREECSEARARTNESCLAACCLAQTVTALVLAGSQMVCSLDKGGSTLRCYSFVSECCNNLLEMLDSK